MSRDVSITVTYSVQAGTYSSYTGGITCGAVAVVTTAVLDGAAGKITITPKDGLPSGASCTASGTIEVMGANAGRSASVGWQVAFTTGATTSWWPPANLIPMGTKVWFSHDDAPADAIAGGLAIADVLPAACKTVGDACWKASVASGLIRVTDTGVVDFQQRPLLNVFYKVNIPAHLVPTLGSGVFYCTKEVLRVDGSWWNFPFTSDAVEDRCVGGGTNPSRFRWAFGNSAGVLFLDTTADGTSTCYQRVFDYPGNVAFYKFVTCPS